MFEGVKKTKHVTSFQCVRRNPVHLKNYNSSFVFFSGLKHIALCANAPLMSLLWL